MDPPSRPGRVARRYARPIPHPLPTRIPSTAASPLLPWRRERTGRVIINWSPVCRSMASSYAPSASSDFSRHLIANTRSRSDSSVHPPWSSTRGGRLFRSLPKRPRVARGAATVASRPRDAEVDTSSRGEASVSAHGERNAENTSSYSNRGICRIYCDGPGRRDVARVGAAAADV